MKIKGKFDTVDSAERAAAAIKHQISTFSDFSVTSENRPAHPHKGRLFYNSYFNSINSPYYAVPATVTKGYDIDEDIYETDLRTDASLEVVCRIEDEKNVSRIMIGCGGRNIKSQS